MINRKTLSEQIYDILKDEILKGHIKFGSKLVNRSLQRRFSVSSSPVRDAINRLNQVGLISNIDNSGATVVEFDFDFFLTINEVLYVIQNAGISLSLEKSDVNRVGNELDGYIKGQKDNIGTELYYKYDYLFHKTFMQYSENTRLIKIYEEYNVLHEILVRNYHRIMNLETHKKSIKEHIGIKEAFVAKDRERAIRLNEEHFKYAEALFSQVLKKTNKL